MRFTVPEHFRQSMGWLHTWLGIALAAVLFAVFWTGTLTVFDREIDQWMKPELRIPAPPGVSLDETALPRLAQLDVKPGSLVWVGIPRERIPAIRLFYDDAKGESHEEWLDPRTGEVLELTDSHAGSEFLFRFHFMLHMPGVLGYYIVGLAALGMLALVISGIFVHRKFIQDFFTFRRKKQARRAFLDFHNLTAVVGLPFHFLIPFSGLLILVTTWFPWSMALPFDGDIRKLESELLAYETPRIVPAGRPGAAVTTLDAPVARANAMWRAEEGPEASGPDWVAIFNVNDAASYVVVERFFANRRVALGPDQIVFNPDTGQVIDQFKPLPVHGVSSWLEGMHWIQFDHWALRWLYFVAGLGGCAMIGSGLVYWMQARISKTRPDPASVRIVRAIGVGSTTGIIIATACFLVANRLVPRDIALEGVHRHDLEIFVFFLTWVLAYIHAAVRRTRAWREQCLAIAALSALAVVLNWFTTGHHLVAVAGDPVWPVAIMDCVLLAAGATAFWAARRLRKSGA
jgi:uncharacterized iron-regulated membrane protein